MNLSPVGKPGAPLDLGAVGGLLEQGIKCAQNGKAACSATAFLKAGVIGAVVGGVSGALGGKVLASIGGKAFKAVGGLFGRGGGDVAEGGASDVIEGGAENVTSDAADSGASGGADNAADGTATNAADDAGAGGGHEPTAEEPSASGKQEPGCGGAPHSFVGATRVVMADGNSKAIDEIKVGDQVENSVPGQTGTQIHTVDRVIVTTTDHDFVDVTVVARTGRAEPAGPPSTGRHTLTKVGLALAGAATLAATTGAATLTTTYHHPFYDRTQAAFVEAKDLHPGDELQMGCPVNSGQCGLRADHADSA